MRTLVTGITGGIGSQLAPKLLAAGHGVRALTRGDRPARVRVPAGVEVLTGDVLSGAGLLDALQNVDVAYYLIHSMETSTDGHFGERERTAAENFATAARQTEVRRIVYLGGLVSPTGKSEHLKSRLAVERILLGAVPESIAFRASIVIGAHSRPFRFLVRLVERMPVIVLPAWRTHRTAPVDERDVLSCLVGAASATSIAGRSLDLTGPDVVTYGELIDRIREQLLLDRPVLSIPRVALTPLASRLSALIASEDHALIGPLMEGLQTDLLPTAESATHVLGVRRHSLNAAIERALRDWELMEPLRAR